MISVNPALFTEGQPILIRECELTAAQLEEIINRSGIDEKLKEVKVVDSKLDEQIPSILEQALLVGKEKIVPDLQPDIDDKIDEATTQKIDSPDKQFLSLVVMRRKKPGTKETRKSSIPNSKDQRNNVALCSMCGKKFSSNYNLRRHMTSCKLCPDLEKGPRFQCACGRSYSQEWDMKKHKSTCKDNGKKCKSCLVPGCKLLFYHRAQLVSHMKTAHSVDIQDPEVLEFQSIEEFRIWKEKEEEETYTYYSKQTGANVTGVSVNTYYVCQHDGSDRTHGPEPRKTERRNKKGRVKTGRLCWSQMNVKEFWNGSVKVTYYPSHTHAVSSADTEHHPLSSKIHTEIHRRMTQLKSTEEGHTTDYNDFKKSRKRSHNMNLRALRSLARKNRKLFQITAEAVDEAHELTSIEVKNEVVEEPILVEEAPAVLLTSSKVDEQALAEEKKNELTAVCNSYIEHIKSFMDTGKLSSNFLSQIESTLSDLTQKCRDEVVRVENESAQSICELTEVIYQPDAISTKTFPLSKEHITTVPLDKTLYQVVTLEQRDQPSSPQTEDLIYQNSMELVGPREFIIIANDHAQIFCESGVIKAPTEQINISF